MLHLQTRAALAEATETGDYLIPGRPGFDLTQTRTELRARAGPRGKVAHVADVDADGVACRLFRPHPSSPVVLYLHGRGWKIGSVDEAEPLSRLLANRSRWAVLAVEYRLALEHKALPDLAFPTAHVFSHKIVASSFLHQAVSALHGSPKCLERGSP